MADVYAVFGTLIALGIAYPGLLAAWRLIFPEFVQKAQERMRMAGRGSLGLGVLVGLPAIGAAVLLISVPAPFVRFVGALLALTTLTLASMGASGLAGYMGAQLNRQSGGKISTSAAHLRGAVALELASIFPLIGWLIVLPIATLTCLGVGVYALFARPVTDDHSLSVEAVQPSEA